MLCEQLHSPLQWNLHESSSGNLLELSRLLVIEGMIGKLQSKALCHVDRGKELGSLSLGLATPMLSSGAGDIRSQVRLGGREASWVRTWREMGRR